MLSATSNDNSSVSSSDPFCCRTCHLSPPMLTTWKSKFAILDLEKGKPIGISLDEFRSPLRSGKVSLWRPMFAAESQSKTPKSRALSASSYRTSQLITRMSSAPVHIITSLWMCFGTYCEETAEILLRIDIVAPHKLARHRLFYSVCLQKVVKGVANLACPQRVTRPSQRLYLNNIPRTSAYDALILPPT
jgi:hypothetical protein